MDHSLTHGSEAHHGDIALFSLHFIACALVKGYSLEMIRIKLFQLSMFLLLLDLSCQVRWDYGLLNPANHIEKRATFKFILMYLFHYSALILLDHTSLKIIFLLLAGVLC